MKIEDQVCSLELAKQLKELGVKQDSLFYINANGNLFYKDNPTKIEGYSAFTATELCEGLPARIKTDYDSWTYLYIGKLENTKEWFVAYYHDEIKGNTLANACAKMRIHLLKNNLICGGE